MSRETDSIRVDDTIRHFLESYRDAFNRLDPDAIADHFHVPSTMTTNADCIVWTARAQVVDNMRQLCDRYRANGFVAATYEPLEVVVQPPVHAFANVRWTVERQPGSSPWRFRTSYNLRRAPDRWRVLLCTAYEEGRRPKE